MLNDMIFKSFWYFFGGNDLCANTNTSFNPVKDQQVKKAQISISGMGHRKYTLYEMDIKH